MVREPTVTFAMRELDRLKCIQAVIDGDLRPGRAAEGLGLMVRQIERLVNRYRAEGSIRLISRHRNRAGNRGINAPLAEHVLGILRELAPRPRGLRMSMAISPASMHERRQTICANASTPQSATTVAQTGAACRFQ
jgi:hypothetical protein